MEKVFGHEDTVMGNNEQGYDRLSNKLDQI